MSWYIYLLIEVRRYSSFDVVQGSQMHCIAVQTDYPQRDDDAATLMASIANPCYSSRSAGYKVQLTPRIIYSSMLLIPTLNYTTGTPLPLAASCYCNLYIYIYIYIHTYTHRLSFFLSSYIISVCSACSHGKSLHLFSSWASLEHARALIQRSSRILPQRQWLGDLTPFDARTRLDLPVR